MRLVSACVHLLLGWRLATAMRVSRPAAYLLLLSGCSGGGLPGEVTTLAGGPAEGNRDAVGLDARFSGPADMAIGPSGTVYLADVFNHSIRTVRPDGAVATVVGNGEAGYVDGPWTRAQLRRPAGLAVRGEVLYVADAGNHVIRRVDLSERREVTTIAGTAGEAGFRDGPLDEAQFDGPQAIDFEGATNRLWVADTGNNAVRVVDLDHSVVHTIAGDGNAGTADGRGAEARFTGPGGIVVQRDGVAWVTEFLNHTIRRVESDGTVRTAAGQPRRKGTRDGPLHAALLNRPVDIDRTGDGRLAFVDKGSNRLRWLQPGHRVGTLAGKVRRAEDDLEPLPEARNGSAGRAVFRSPRGIAVDGDTLFVTDEHSVRVVRGWR